jgi:hypothetical protein
VLEQIIVKLRPLWLSLGGKANADTGPTLFTLLSFQRSRGLTVIAISKRLQALGNSRSLIACFHCIGIISAAATAILV